MAMPKLDPPVFFEERAYSFRYFVRMAHRDASAAMNMRTSERVWHSGVVQGIQEHFPNADTDDFWEELLRLLVNSMQGDFLVVKAVEESQGCEAWWKLVHQRAPRSMARAVRLVGLFASPPKISDPAKAEADIRKREDHPRTLAKQIRQSFSDTGKVSIMLRIVRTPGMRTRSATGHGTERESGTKRKSAQCRRAPSTALEWRFLSPATLPTSWLSLWGSRR